MVNLLFSGNDYVFDGVLTCLLSIFKRTERKEPFRVYIFTMDVTRIKSAYKPINSEAVAFLEKVAKSYNPENEIILKDVGKSYDKELAYCPNESAYCSPYTLLRLLADIELPEVEDKLLYLDADIMFNRDILLLYDTDTEGYEYAAARDHYGKFLLRPDYINAGVLLFNMKECRKTGIFAKSREKLRQKKMLFADQDALFRSTKRKKLLPQRSNDQKFLHHHTVVSHFSKRLFYLPYPHTDNIKQWQVDKVRKVFGYHQFDDVFDEYLRLKKIFSKENQNNEK